jgi:hypothetical protein
MSTEPLTAGGVPVAAASVVSQQLHVPPPAVVERWPSCTPQLVLNQLKQLVPTEMGANSKLLPNSYRFWAQMSEGQVRTTMQFWDRLPHDKQVTILATASASTTLASNAVTATAAAATQDAPTTKHDIARLLHVRMDPEIAMAWAATRQGWTDRRVMDARNSSSAPDGRGGGLDEAADPWGRIAERYMDYVGFQPQVSSALLRTASLLHSLTIFPSFSPQNELIRYANGQPVVPYSPISAQMTGLAAVCNELRPTLMSRKDIARDGTWVKTLWRKTKGTLSAVFEDFTRSGTHRSPNMADVEWNDATEQARWVRQCNKNHRTYPDVSAYAYAIMDESDFQSLGKVQAPGAGRDDSIAGEGEGSAALANARRTSRKGGGKGKGKRTRVTDDGDQDIGAALREAAVLDARCDVLKFTAQNGNTAQKAAAMTSLFNFASTGHFEAPDQAPSARVRRRRSSTSTASSASSAASALSEDSDSDSEEEYLEAASDSVSVGSRSSVFSPPPSSRQGIDARGQGQNRG